LQFAMLMTAGVVGIGLVATLVWAPETNGVSLYEASTGQSAEAQAASTKTVS
jgi:hypothetical protein